MAVRKLPSSITVLSCMPSVVTATVTAGDMVVGAGLGPAFAGLVGGCPAPPRSVPRLRCSVSPVEAASDYEAVVLSYGHPAPMLIRRGGSAEFPQGLLRAPAGPGRAPQREPEAVPRAVRAR
jgi:hypothetical protein